jgi:hypothetical protein
VGKFRIDAKPFGPGLSVFHGDTEKAPLGAEEAVDPGLEAGIATAIALRPAEGLARAQTA